MKAQRRHELQTNTLATKLVTLPDFGKKYGPRAVIGLVLAVSVGVLSYRYFAGQTQLLNVNREKLAFARDLTTRLRMYPHIYTVPPGQAVEARSLLKDVLDSSRDPQMLAQTLVTLGDLDWNLAKSPPYAEQGLEEEGRHHADFPPEELIKMAQQAYQEVLDKYPTQTYWAASARFGLAAIAEDQAVFSTEKDRWDIPRKYYQDILKTPDVVASLKELAQSRLDMLPQIAHAPIFGAAPEDQPTTLTSQPSASTEPSIQQTLIQPATLPAPLHLTAPIPRPTTAPATGPR